MTPQLDPQIKAVLNEIVARTPDLGDAPSDEVSYLTANPARDRQRWGAVAAAVLVVGVAGLLASGVGSRESRDAATATRPMSISVGQAPTDPSPEGSLAGASAVAPVLFEHLEYATNPAGIAELRLKFDARIDDTNVVDVVDATSASTTAISYFVQDGTGTTHICHDEHYGYAPTIHVLLPGLWFDEAAEARGFVFPVLGADQLSADGLVGKIVGCRIGPELVEVAIALPEPIAIDALRVEAVGDTLRVVPATPLLPGGVPCANRQDPVLDVANEPPLWRHDGYTDWFRNDCLVRVDVITDRPGPGHCGWESTRVIVVGRPIGTRFTTSNDDLEYVRDPTNVVGLRGDLELDTGLPPQARDTGYRSDTEELWIDPDDDKHIYLVADTHTERWPAGEPPLCS